MIKGIFCKASDDTNLVLYRSDKGKMIVTKSPKATLELGERLAQQLKPGDCLALVGELGAGKTTLIKGLARGLHGAGT